MKKTISNYFKVRRRIPADTNYSLAAKWAASKYKIGFHSSLTDISNESTPILNTIGYSNSIISQDIYNEIQDAVKKINASYYNDTNVAFNRMQTEATVALIQASLVVYSMICAVWRAQNGYLFKDKDGIYMSPVLFNAEEKHANSSDWAAGGSTSFVTSVAQHNYDTQAELQNGPIAFAFSVANEPWANYISRTTKACYLPKHMRQLAEHLFTTVFMDPDASYNPAFVTLFPASCYVRYDAVFNADDSSILESLHAVSREITGYDRYSETDIFEDSGNICTWDNLTDYLDDYVEYVDTLFEVFPQMHLVLEQLNITDCNNKFDFTRSLTHDELLIIDTENISDLIQTTAYSPHVTGYGNYNEPLDQHLRMAPVIVRDKERSHYAADMKYINQIEIETNLSFELFLQGKVVPLQFANFDYVGSRAEGNYNFTYLVPRQFLTSMPDDQTANITVVNAQLLDYGAVTPIYYIGQETQTGSNLGDFCFAVPTIHCFYKDATELAVMVESAQTSFWK